MTEPNSTVYPIIWDSRHNPSFEVLAEGITKREYFAALFTAAYIQCPGNHQPNWVDENAKIAVEQADALIKELNKSKP